MKSDKKTIAECERLVKEYFGGNVNKTLIWFKIKNPMLGGMAPLDMIKMGRAKKLLEMIKTARMENLRE